MALDGPPGRGTLNSSFGTNGRTTTAIGPSGGASGIAIQNGNIIVSGVTFNFSTSTTSFEVARYDRFAGMALEPDGTIVVVGTTLDASGLYDDFALAEYNADGSLFQDKHGHH
jgi:hypothetical protein